MRICTISGCEGKHKANGYCNKHYHRVRKYGDPFANFTQIKEIKDCTVNDCKKIAATLNLCQMHYRRYKLYGDPEIRINNYRSYVSCSVPECKKKHSSKGYCKVHYQSILKPEIARRSKRRRRAKKLENGIDFYTEKQVLDVYGTDCYICKKPIDLKAPRTTWTKGWQKGLHIEHYIDIALGGPDTLENVRPSHAICNLTKTPRAMV